MSRLFVKHIPHRLGCAGPGNTRGEGLYILRREVAADGVPFTVPVAGPYHTRIAAEMKLRNLLPDGES